MLPTLKEIIMATDTPNTGEKHEFTERDALAFAMESEEVTQFLAQGPLLEKLVMRVFPPDFTRLREEYPTLFPPEIYQRPYDFQVYSITFIRGKPSAQGHAKMKIYVEMTGRRVLKIFATS